MTENLYLETTKKSWLIRTAGKWADTIDTADTREAANHAANKAVNRDGYDEVVIFESVAVATSKIEPAIFVDLK